MLLSAWFLSDAPLFFDSGVTGGQPWEPKNYDGKFDGPMSLRTGLAKSKNMVSIRILNATGVAIDNLPFTPERVWTALQRPTVGLQHR